MSKLLFTLMAIGVLVAPANAAGDPNRGAQLYRACAACHSLEPDRNMTGPSLAGVWGRKAGTLASFPRYSPAVKGSDVVWNEQTLDSWLQDPAHFIPGNRMTFPGIKEAQARSDLIAYLKAVPGSGQAAQGAPGGQMGGMMMGGRPAPNLKKLDAEDRVQAITYCRDTYRVTTADGKTQEFWERNLRFKTDSGPDGPEKGAPAVLGAGMMGDRASLVFAAPEEIGAFIKPGC
jgi:cytochrome c